MSLTRRGRLGRAVAQRPTCHFENIAAPDVSE